MPLGFFYFPICILYSVEEERGQAIFKIDFLQPEELEDSFKDTSKSKNADIKRFYYVCYASLTEKKNCGNFMLKPYFLLCSFVSFTTFASQLKTIWINVHWNQYQSGGLIKVHAITNIWLGRLHKHVSIYFWNIFLRAVLWPNHREIQNTEIYV